MPEKWCCGVVGSPIKVHKWGIEYWAFWVSTYGFFWFWVLKGREGVKWLIVTLWWVERMVRHLEWWFKPKTWSAGVAHGGAQWEQKLLRISILRCEITRQKKRVNRTLVTINKSSYIHHNLASRGRPTYFDLYNDKISVKKTRLAMCSTI